MNQESDIQEYSAGDSVRIRLQVEHEFEFSTLEAVFEHENFDPTIEGRGEETHAITLVGRNTEQLVRIDGVPPTITSFVMVEGSSPQKRSWASTDAAASWPTTRAAGKYPSTSADRPRCGSVWWRSPSGARR